ncbi:PGF-CTERM protein/surface glycoprotein [Natrinema hispanicum]|uniref:PGF-CTERM protein/surface glycoprotein n=2 Tax=Natrinema hispanicum TaxID=392421 RepID=A0A1I0ETK3_9EURY|nr:PGF-CTERM sorting domain-containing protein [Natrinema hispanicum]SDC93835.1 PGF-CTERM protein/surface glycoprotein [Natrinema hispanicum]SET48904.1 PGF-CTERM protein/surface glycoprotein [Natrinema hispanicum]
MTTKPTTLEKGRAVMLAGLMVLSVIAMSVAFAGGAAAATEDSVTFNDQAIGVYNDSDTMVVGPIYAQKGQYLEVTDESGEVVDKTVIPVNATDAAIFATPDGPGEYTATLYSEEGGDEIDDDDAMIYDATIELSDQKSAKGTLEQVTVDTASLLDGDDNDTEFDVVLTDADGNELGRATELTGTNEDITIDTSKITAQTEVTATIFVDDEPLQAYDEDAGNFVPVSDSATVDPDMKNKHDEKGDDTKHDKKKGDNDYTEKGEKDKSAGGDSTNGHDSTDSGVSNDASTDQDTSAETNQDQNVDQSNDQDANNDQDEDASQSNSGDSMPGFGVGVALVALLGAAMLAFRQQN